MVLRTISACALAVVVVLTGITFLTIPIPAVADDCATNVDFAGGWWSNSTVSVGVSCSANVGSSSMSGSGSGKSVPCVDAHGVVVLCVKAGRVWTPYHQAWCVDIPTPADHTGDGWMECETLSGMIALWMRQDTPDKPGVSPEQIARRVVDSIGLHTATLNIGAWVDPEFREYGITWWVGAPLWLWIDSSDPLAWGHHRLDASEGGVSVTASVDATSVVYQMGDGTPVSCGNPGVVRPNRRDELMAHESPAQCQHRYQHTNTLGDPDSRYTITGVVTWVVSWTSTTGTSGQFTLTIPTTTTQVHIGEIHITRG